MKLTDLLFPVRCVLCGEPTLHGYPLCEDCLPVFASSLLSPCPVCGAERKNCTCAWSKHYPFVLYYGGKTAKTAVARLKHSGDRRIADFFAAVMLPLCSGIRFDAVCYPPRTKANIRRYGFDHAKALADGLAKRLGIPRRDVFIRRKKAAEQKLLSASQRRKNMENAFEADSKALAGLKHVLLVDDVVTTGATLSACTKILNAAGIRVHTVCFARTPPYRASHGKQKKSYTVVKRFR